MWRIILFTALIFLISTGGFAQAKENTVCPSFSVNGPPGLIPDGETTSFTAILLEKAQNYSPRYRWKVRGGEIVSGQGTGTISVRPTGLNSDLVASVELLGLPEECPNEGSATGPSENGPVPPQLLTDFSLVNGKLDLAEIAGIGAESRDNPNAQVFVVSTFARGTSRAKVQDTVKRLRESLARTQQLEPDRIIFLTGFAVKDRVKIYLVPPWAAKPDCENCEEFKNFDKNDCPTITVNGPAGITNPGEIAIFTGEVSGKIPPNVTYAWTVSEGAIVSGQNTLSVRIRYPKTEASNLTATLVIGGLPESCPSEFSAAAPFVIDRGPLLIDEYGASTPQDEHAHLKAAVAQLKKHPNSMLWIIFYPTGSDASIKRKEKLISDYLTKDMRISGQFGILIGPNKGIIETKIYIVPPGVENPQP